MNVSYIDEPSLQFGDGQHICPRSGIYAFGPQDINSIRPEKITIGVVGLRESIEKVIDWIEECKTHIPGKESKKPRPNLFMNFPGFNSDIAFKSEIVYDDSYMRSLSSTQINKVFKSELSKSELVSCISEIFLEEIKYLAQNKSPDVIICVLNKHIYDLLKKSDSEIDPSSLSDEEYEEISTSEKVNDKDEMNFRRYLKAKSMGYNVPIQILRDSIVSPNAEMQDSATIAWNVFTAIYYKASGVPWALIRKDVSLSTCYAGISFYKSRDGATLQTSVAQIFNELGSGVILRGGEVNIEKGDRVPHLNEDQAYDLLTKSLKEYYVANKSYPRRLVIHKTSNFNEKEKNGFLSAAENLNIYNTDMVTISPSSFRLYRDGQYPPLRGTSLSIDKENILLYTRGAVPYYETYPGLYIPQPVHLKLFDTNESPKVICEEIIGLSKMNWNNTQFDRKFPVTIECSRNVGEILKYLDEEENPALKYSFYM